MFVGHYAAAFALKGKERAASLGMLFVATQLVDILFFPFTQMGIERIRLVDNFTATNNFDLEYMPYTHGLLGSMCWAVLVYLLYRFVLARKKPQVNSIAFVMAVGVLSHWFADLLTHTPDLPIINGDPKLGLGMWRNKNLTFLTEISLLGFSVYYYLRKAGDIKPIGRYAAIGFGVFLALAAFLNFYVLPPEKNTTSLAFSALASYATFAAIAFWVDKKNS